MVLVDNASEDGCGEYARKRFPEVDVIRCEPNRGFAGGNNFGWEHIQRHYPDTDFLALLNADTQVHSGWLTPLVDFLEAHPHAGAAQPKIMLYDRACAFNTVGNRSHYLGFGMMTGYQEEDLGQYDTPCEIHYPSGAAVMIRMDWLRELGLFDEAFYMTLEDADLGWKLRLAGHPNWYVPTSKVYHKYIPDTPHKLYEYLERNRWILLLTYYPLRTLLLLSPALFFMEIGQIVFALMNRLLSAKLKSWTWFWRGENLLHLKNRRRAAKQMRVPEGVELATGFVGEICLPSGNPVILKWIGNPLLRRYWRCVRKMIQ